MAAHGSCNGQSSINFAVLSLIRGTTPLMMCYAVMKLDSAGLVVSIKCAITLLFFLITASWQLFRDDQTKMKVTKNLSTFGTYWKLLVIGLFQSAAPYILATYSLQYFPPTMLGVFMVTSPWWSAIFERLPFIKIKSRMPGTTKIGMVFGVVGIIFMISPVIKESVVCSNAADIAAVIVNNATANISDTTTTMFPPTTEKQPDLHLGIYDLCVPVRDLVAGFFALLFAPMLWGGAAVFWKFQRKGTHFLVSSIGQNLVGGVLAALFWVAAERKNTHIQWNDKELVIGLVFLGIATGWLATLLVQHLYASLGPKTTNQVMTTIPFIAFIQDCIFFRDVITIFPWVVAMEILGLLLVTTGVFVSNMKLSTNPRNRPRTSRRDSLSEGLLGTSYNDDDSTTSGFYTSVTRGDVDQQHDHSEDEEQMDTDYANYEPPPMVITTEDQNNIDNDQETAPDNSGNARSPRGQIASGLKDVTSVQLPNT